MTKAEQACACGHLISSHGFDLDGKMICTGCDCVDVKVKKTKK